MSGHALQRGQEVVEVYRAHFLQWIQCAVPILPLPPYHPSNAEQQRGYWHDRLANDMDRLQQPNWFSVAKLIPNLGPEPEQEFDQCLAKGAIELLLVQACVLAEVQWDIVRVKKFLNLREEKKLLGPLLRENLKKRENPRMGLRLFGKQPLPEDRCQSVHVSVLDLAKCDEEITSLKRTVAGITLNISERETEEEIRKALLEILHHRQATLADWKERARSNSSTGALSKQAWHDLQVAKRDCRSIKVAYANGAKPTLEKILEIWEPQELPVTSLANPEHARLSRRAEGRLGVLTREWWPVE